MAKYIVNNSKFTPFTFDEMLKPLAIYGQEYRAQEEALAALDEKASVWEGMANEQSDPYAYKMYKKYADDLEAQAGELARSGLSLTSRKAMLDLRARYNKEIFPIETAYKKREELAAEQRKAIAANPTLRYQRMAKAMSLDDLIKDPTLDYGESYSGALLTQQVSQAAANLQRALTDKGNLKDLGLPYQYERMLQYGATPAQVMAAMSQDAEQGDSEAVQFLRGITDQVLKSSGVADWADPATMEEFRAFANQGLYSAIGQVKIDNFTDTFSMNDALEQRKEARAAARAARDAQELNAIKLSGISYLQASGALGKYEKALSGLKAGQNGINAEIFGKYGTVNPLTVYDKAQANMAAAERRVRSQYESKIRSAKNRAEYEVGGYGPDNDKVKRLQSQMNSAISSARTKAYQETLTSYGVSQGITKDQYDALKAIGYNGKSAMLSYNQLTDPLSALAQQRSYYSTNMASYDIPDQKIRAQLGNWNNNGNFSTAVYRLNADGTQGKSVSYKDLKLAGDDGKGRKVTGIYYSAFTPGKIIVQIGESGDRYLMDPNVLGSEVAALVNQTKSIIASDSSVDLTEASVATTIALSRLLNSYNPTAPKSQKDAGE